jgi:hypothetical protein
MENNLRTWCRQSDEKYSEKPVEYEKLEHDQSSESYRGFDKAKKCT